MSGSVTVNAVQTQIDPDPSAFVITLPSDLAFVPDITVDLPVRLPQTGIVTIGVTLTGSHASLGVARGTATTTAVGAPIGATIYPPFAVDVPTGGQVVSAYLYRTSVDTLGGIRTDRVMKVTLPVPHGYEPIELQPVFVDPSGVLQYLRGTVRERSITFEVAHLGTFGLVRIPKPSIMTLGGKVPQEVGYHARWRGQSEQLPIGPDQLIDVSIAFLNSGDQAWHRGVGDRQANLGSSRP